MQSDKVYLQSEFELRSFVEKEFFEFEGVQSTTRPFIFWTNEAVIYDMWIPFSKITFIGKDCYKTYSKKELRALLSSSFQKFGKFWFYFKYLPMFLLIFTAWLLLASFGLAIVFRAFPDCYEAFYKMQPCSAWASFWIMIIISPLSLMLRFYFDSLIIRAPQESADKKAIAIYGEATELYSALIATKKHPVYAGFFLADVFYGNSLIFFSLSMPRFIFINALVQQLFAFASLVLIVYLMLEGREYKVDSRFNTSNTIDARIKNLGKIIEVNKE